MAAMGFVTRLFGSRSLTAAGSQSALGTSGDPSYFRLGRAASTDDRCVPLPDTPPRNTWPGPARVFRRHARSHGPTPAPCSDSRGTTTRAWQLVPTVFGGSTFLAPVAAAWPTQLPAHTHA